MILKNKAVSAMIFAIIAISGSIFIFGVIGFPIFPSNIDDSKKQYLIGCYWSNKNLVFRVDGSAIHYGPSDFSKYNVISDKVGLAIFPDALLRWEEGSNRPGSLVKIPGDPELIPYDSDKSSLKITTIDRSTVEFLKRKCN